MQKNFINQRKVAYEIKLLKVKTKTKRNTNYFQININVNYYIRLLLDSLNAGKSSVKIGF